MKRVLLIAALTLLTLVSFAPSRAQTPARMTILFTGDCRGWIKPCGCAGGEMAGGLMRRATFIEQQRVQNPQLVVVDLGHNFQGGTRQERIKAQTLLESLRLSGYTTATFGANDFLFGANFLAKYGPAPYVSANVTLRDAPQGLSVPYKLVEMTPRSLMIVGVTGPDVLYSGEQGSLSISDPLQAVREQLAAADAMSPRPVVLVLAAVKPDDAKRIFELPGVDLLVRSYAGGAAGADNPTYTVVGKRAWAEAADQGRLVGRFELSLAPDGALEQVSVDYTPLGDKLADHPEHKKFYEAYLDEVKKIFIEAAQQAQLHEQQSPFAGSESCMNCHSADFDKWTQTQHALAMQSLAEAGQDFDPECVVCHSVGYGTPGGFVSMDFTPGLGNVGCEVCHGARKAHTADPTIKGVPADVNTCLRCHTTLRDPQFEFGKRWQTIKHGKGQAD
ncbi:MAG: multiheme c-type cytochrome [Candidatus Alcyoniella australis]|nr:multiheme c-type cytochrome [Candidatus Alcyoniella australis]